MNWTKEQPTELGWYVFKSQSEWPLRVMQVKLGNWRLTQDPDQLYASGELLTEILQGFWLGPLPEVPA